MSYCTVWAALRTPNRTQQLLFATVTVIITTSSNVCIYYTFAKNWLTLGTPQPWWILYRRYFQLYTNNSPSHTATIYRLAIHSVQRLYISNTLASHLTYTWNTPDIRHYILCIPRRNNNLWQESNKSNHTYVDTEICGYRDM